MNRCTSMFGAVCVIGSLAALGGCEKKPAPPAGGAPPTAAPTSAPAPAPAAVKNDDHDPAEAGHDDGHGDAADLGITTIGGFTVKVAQEGLVAEGSDVAFDIVISGGIGKPAAVRGWIGTEDAKGAIKVKADMEGEGYHLHAEAAKPLPAGAKFCIEIENDKGEKSVGSLAFKK